MKMSRIPGLSRETRSCVCNQACPPGVPAHGGRGLALDPGLGAAKVSLGEYRISQEGSPQSRPG